MEADSKPTSVQGVKEVTPDPGMLRTVIEVLRHIDIEEQLGELAAQIEGQVGAEFTFGYAIDLEGRTFETASWTRRLGPARRPALNRVSTTEVESWGPGDLVRFGGGGPFVDTSTGWKGELPVETAAWILRGEEGMPRGLLVFVNPKGADEPWLKALGELLRKGLDNAIQVRAVRELVIRDDTADCFNRRYFEESLPEELARAARFHSPMSMIFFDMDNLKEVNTRFGHARGSQTLREVAKRVRIQIRKFDKLFRFGGDEFCIVLPETEWHGALEVAERVRESVAGTPFLTGPKGVPDGVAMTASFGIASYPLHARTKEALVEEADRAMRRIKTGPKNSIAVAETPVDDASD